MKHEHIITNPKVNEVFSNYPDTVRPKMEYLKELVIKTAQEIEDLDTLELTLKWGEPSFVTKKGSTFRVDWKQKTPNQYAMYFQCTSRLVTTFKAVFGSLFTYEGNRAIVFAMDEHIPEKELKHCIRAALCYHEVKGDLTLGL